MMSTAELLIFLGKNPVRSCIIDISDVHPIVTLLCGATSLRNVPAEQLQTLLERDLLPQFIAEHLVSLDIIRHSDTLPE
jgi:hypothetical protein